MPRHHRLRVVLLTLTIAALLWAALISAALLAAHLGGTNGSEVIP